MKLLLVTFLISIHFHISFFSRGLPKNVTGKCNETRLEAFKHNYIPQIQVCLKFIHRFSHTGGLT